MSAVIAGTAQSTRVGRLEPLTPLIGAEVGGVDLAQLDERLIAQIRSDLLDHLVLFFRDQRLTIEQHKALGRAFGELHIHPIVVPQIPEHPEVIVLEADANTGKPTTDLWHSDGTADINPPLGSILYMHEVPANGGGDTLWANTYAAYEDLAEDMKKRLDGLRAVHDAERLRGSRGIKNGAERLIANSHPVVRTHPETGRKCLYVNRQYTSHIEGLDRQESDTLLGFLFAHQESPKYQCRFKWRANSIAFWDNRCTLHYAVYDYYPHRRYAQRVTICGDRPY